MIYAHFDGDDVGSKLELMLLDDDEESARDYSNSINIAIARVQEILSRSGAAIVLSGGDDLIASWTADSISFSDIERVRQTFRDVCGCTLSVGIGFCLSEAASSLRRAKLQGKDQVIQTTASRD
ncbi:mCpol domain-containing protein [Actinomadura sp. RB99]|uniref:mCpol domain-containing protein n=1 Tax=Actinomadura sp. RB99 TaxID=2691577 RepID=UPI001685341A